MKHTKKIIAMILIAIVLIAGALVPNVVKTEASDDVHSIVPPVSYETNQSNLYIGQALGFTRQRFMANLRAHEHDS